MWSSISDVFNGYNDVKYINRYGKQARYDQVEHKLTRKLIGGTFNYVKVTFDPAKRLAALSERGLDFKDAEFVFDGLTITVQDTRKDYGEDRFQTVGYLANRMVMLVWTPRSEARHIISMRKCNDREKAIYQKRFGEG